jgi:hypothetical protein
MTIPYIVNGHLRSTERSLKAGLLEPYEPRSEPCKYTRPPAEGFAFA